MTNDNLFAASLRDLHSQRLVYGLLGSREVPIRAYSVARGEGGGATRGQEGAGKGKGSGGRGFAEGEARAASTYQEDSRREEGKGKSAAVVGMQNRLIYKVNLAKVSMTDEPAVGFISCSKPCAMSLSSCFWASSQVIAGPVLIRGCYDIAMWLFGFDRAFVESSVDRDYPALRRPAYCVDFSCPMELPSPVSPDMFIGHCVGSDT